MLGDSRTAGLGAAVMCCASIALGDTLVVPTDFRTIQDAMDAAQQGDTVLLLDGVYTGFGNKDLTFSGKAFIVRSANGPKSCVIDCEGAGRAFVFASEGPQSIVHGLTMTGGNPVGVGELGGGVFCSATANPTIIDCVLTDNFACNIACLDFSKATLLDCEVSRGSGTSYGAGLYLDDFASANIVNCVFADNESSYIGGGIWWGSESNGLVINSTFTGNSADVWGGAIAFFLSEVQIRGSTFSENFAGDRGGAIICLGSSNWGNTTHVDIENSIFWNDSAVVAGPEISVLSTKFGHGAAVVDYSDIRGGESAVEVSPGSILFWGIGNIEVDPLFRNPKGGDFHLTSSSPCIDAGDPGFVPQLGELDIDGESRLFQGGRIDLGSDEVHPFMGARP